MSRPKRSGHCKAKRRMEKETSFKHKLKRKRETLKEQTEKLKKLSKGLLKQSQKNKNLKRHTGRLCWCGEKMWKT